METLTPQQVRRVQHLPAIHTRQELTPPGWHDLRSPYIPYYNRRSVLTCTASGVAAGIWYVLDVLRRCDTLQRGAGGIIAAFVGLVSVALEWDKSQETHL